MNKQSNPIATRVVLILGAVFLISQFFRPEKNISNNQAYDVSKKYHVPDSVATLLRIACNDCHSNHTTYPWYAEVQPVAWWLDNHIKHGKRNLNFSEFTNLSIARQNHKFEEIIEVVKEREMPLESYTFWGFHSDANLTDAQRKMLIDWAHSQMDMLKANYPTDSLVMPKRLSIRE